MNSTCRYQPSRANSTVRLVTGMRHLPYEERLQRLDLHSLQRRRLRADLFTAFKIFTDVLVFDPNIFPFLPHDTAQESTPTRYLKVRATAEREGRHFRWGLRNPRISSRYSSLCQYLGWRTSFPISPIDWTLISPFPYSPPKPPAHHPLTVVFSICYPTPYTKYAVSSGPLGPIFYHYKS